MAPDDTEKADDDQDMVYTGTGMGQRSGGDDAPLSRNDTFEKGWSEQSESESEPHQPEERREQGGSSARD